MYGHLPPPPQLEPRSSTVLAKFHNDEALAVLWMLLKEIQHIQVQDNMPESTRVGPPNLTLLADMLADAFAQQGKRPYKAVAKEKLDMLARTGWAHGKVRRGCIYSTCALPAWQTWPGSARKQSPWAHTQLGGSMCFSGGRSAINCETWHCSVVEAGWNTA